jgi:hypothetical protein
MNQAVDLHSSDALVIEFEFTGIAREGSAIFDESQRSTDPFAPLRQGGRKTSGLDS